MLSENVHFVACDLAGVRDEPFLAEEDDASLFVLRLGRLNHSIAFDCVAVEVAV